MIRPAIENNKYLENNTDKERKKRAVELLI